MRFNGAGWIIYVYAELWLNNVRTCESALHACAQACPVEVLYVGVPIALPDRHMANLADARVFHFPCTQLQQVAELQFSHKRKTNLALNSAYNPQSCGSTTLWRRSGHRER